MIIDIPKGTCICSICKEEKDNSEFTFYRHRINQRGEKAGQRLRVNTNCKECAAKRTKEKNAIEKSVKHFKPAPGSPCPCCGRITQKFEFDHCHETGIFRGYVCKDCNVGFGKLGDNARGILNAWKYIIRSLPDTDEKKQLLTEMIEVSNAVITLAKYEN